MSKLNVNQKTVKSLFSENNPDFLIPDYQRPYDWGEEECQTLWDDLYTFAFPDNNADNFRENEEYYLGPIVTFKNEGKLEVIDGQQRLTTLMLLLRAFYQKFGGLDGNEVQKAREMISKCIWKTDELDVAIFEKLKIDSEVTTDDLKHEFLEILKNGEATDKQKSTYANNYRFFQKRIADFVDTNPTYFTRLPARILGKCILLPIEAESQETALRIFSTLNDRGKPLSDADIFKAQFYKFFKDKGKKDAFIARWKTLEGTCKNTFLEKKNTTSTDELFSRYMYFLRAKKGIKDTTTIALRKFYEGEDKKYTILKCEETLKDLETLASFWKAVKEQNKEYFSEKILKLLFVLNGAPNAIWTFFVSVYFMQNKVSETKQNESDDDEQEIETFVLDEETFADFLNKTIAFVWATSISGGLIGAFRTPIFAEMVNIVRGKQVGFSDYMFERKQMETALNTCEFPNQRPITRAMLTWWSCTDSSQPLLVANDEFQIEHIVSKERQNRDNILKDEKNIESLGNKALLERRINIPASDYKFSDKIKFYQGYKDSKGKPKEGTKIAEFKKLCNKPDFVESDIVERKNQIIDSFMKFLEDNGLLKD